MSMFGEETGAQVTHKETVCLDSRTVLELHYVRLYTLIIPIKLLNLKCKTNLF